MSTQRKLWIGLAVLLAVSFAALLWVGSEIHRVMPPDPVGSRHRSRRDDLHARRHREGPAGLAVDRRPAARLDLGSRQLRRAGLDRRLAASRGDRVARHRSPARNAEPYAELAPEHRPRLRRSCSRAFARTPSTHAPAPSRVSPIVPRRSRRSRQHYTALFGNDPQLRSLRKAYAMKNDTVLDADKRQR